MIETDHDTPAGRGPHMPTAAEIWLKIAKKNASVATVTIAEALDVALYVRFLTQGPEPGYSLSALVPEAAHHSRPPRRPGPRCATLIAPHAPADTTDSSTSPNRYEARP